MHVEPDMLHTDVQSMCANGAKTYGKYSRTFNTECGQSVHFDHVIHVILFILLCENASCQCSSETKEKEEQKKEEKRI